MKKPKYIIGNWKMNGDASFVEALVRPLTQKPLGEGVTVVLCPPATLLFQLYQAIAGSGLTLGGQDCHAEDKGAFTGSISAPMLKEAGAKYVISGHSERRHLLGETSPVVRKKAEAALRAGLVPIICVGETLAERENGQTLAVIAAQLEESLPQAKNQQILIAYEPVWAIGTGRTASMRDIEEVHRFIHDKATGVPVLYGGSVKADNAAEILAADGVDGVLIGGASLTLAEFAAIIDAANIN